MEILILQYPRWWIVAGLSMENSGVRVPFQPLVLKYLPPPNFLKGGEAFVEQIC